MEHGALTGHGTRWCQVHGHEHGELYPCPEYPESVLDEIDVSAERWRSALQDPEWIKRQLAAGVPPIAILGMQQLAGVR